MSSNENGKRRPLTVVAEAGAGQSDGGQGSNGRGARPRVDASPPEGGLSPIEEDLPASSKAYLVDGDIQVPVREIAVGGGQPAVRVYDTSGPQGHDVKQGLPRLRAPWIERRR